MTIGVWVYETEEANPKGFGLRWIGFENKKESLFFFSNLIVYYCPKNEETKERMCVIRIETNCLVEIDCQGGSRWRTPKANHESTLVSSFLFSNHSLSLYDVIHFSTTAAADVEHRSFNFECKQIPIKSGENLISISWQFLRGLIFIDKLAQLASQFSFD